MGFWYRRPGDSPNNLRDGTDDRCNENEIKVLFETIIYNHPPCVEGYQSIIRLVGSKDVLDEEDIEFIFNMSDILTNELNNFMKLKELTVILWGNDTVKDIMHLDIKSKLQTLEAITESIIKGDRKAAINLKYYVPWIETVIEHFKRILDRQLRPIRITNPSPQMASDLKLFQELVQLSKDEKKGNLAGEERRAKSMIDNNPEFAAAWKRVSSVIDRGSYEGRKRSADNAHYYSIDEALYLGQVFVSYWNDWKIRLKC